MGINYCSFGVYVVDICFSLEIVVTENECIDKEVGVKFAKLVLILVLNAFKS